jgi:hypothetical protein
VVDVHVEDVGQIAGDARGDDIALILHRSRGARSGRGGGAAIVGAIGNEEDFGALIDETAGQFGNSLS